MIGEQTRAVLASQVDTELSRDEQETGIDFFASDDRATVTSYVPSIVTPLIRHEDTRIRWVHSAADAGVSGRITADELEDVSPHTLEVEGVQVTIPVGALKIKGKPRVNARPSSVVSTPESSDRVAEVFSE